MYIYKYYLVLMSSTLIETIIIFYSLFMLFVFGKDISYESTDSNKGFSSTGSNNTPFTYSLKNAKILPSKSSNVLNKVASQAHIYSNRDLNSFRGESYTKRTMPNSVINKIGITKTDSFPNFKISTKE